MFYNDINKGCDEFYSGASDLFLAAQDSFIP
jgi:hypothetical protein